MKRPSMNLDEGRQDRKQLVFDELDDGHVMLGDEPMLNCSGIAKQISYGSSRNGKEAQIYEGR